MAGETFTVEAPKAPEFEEGLYDATFDGVETLDKGGFGPFRRWSFTRWEDGDPIRESGGTSISGSTGSRGYAWLCAILGRQPEVGEQIDFASLKDKPCRIMVEANKKGWPTVTDVKPAKQKKGADAS